MDGRVYLIRTVSDTAFVLGTISCPDMINVLIMNQADHNKQNQFNLRTPILVVHYNTEQLLRTPILEVHFNLSSSFGTPILVVHYNLSLTSTDYFPRQ